MTTNKPRPGSTQPDKAQLDRFKQTACEFGCDETGEAFERALAKAAPPRKMNPEPDKER